MHYHLKIIKICENAEVFQLTIEKKQFHFIVIRNCIVVDTSQILNGMKPFVFNRVYTYYIIKKYFWMNEIYYDVEMK